MIYTTRIKQEAQQNMTEDFQNWEIPLDKFDYTDQKLIMEPHGNYEIHLEYQEEGLIKMMGDLKHLQKQKKNHNKDEFYNWIETTDTDIEKELDADVRRDGNYILLIEDQQLQLLNSAGEQKKLKEVQNQTDEVLAYMWETQRPGTQIDPEERGTLHLIPSTQTQIRYKDAEILQKTIESKDTI